VCGHGVANEAYVSEASSDEICLNALKAVTDAEPKAEDSASSVKEDKNAEKFVAVKVEPKENSNCQVAAENETSKLCVKAEFDNSTHDDKTVEVRIKEEELDSKKLVQFTVTQQPAAEGVGNRESSGAAENEVGTTQQSCSDMFASSSVTDESQPTDKLENVNLETNVNTAVENDSCEAVAKVALADVGNVDSKETDDRLGDSVASDIISKAACCTAGSDKSCASDTLSANTEHVGQEQSIKSTTDLTTTTESNCSPSPRLKKLASKQSKTSPTESPGELFDIS